VNPTPRTIPVLIAALGLIASAQFVACSRMGTAPQEASTVSVEAEDAALPPQLVLIADRYASKGAAIKAVEDGRENMGAAELSFESTRRGTYQLWARARFFGFCQNTFYVQLNRARAEAMQGSDTYDQWCWVRGPRVALRAGKNSLRVANRERGAEIDKFLFTTDFYCVPGGLGDDGATVCNFVQGTPRFVGAEGGAGVWRLKSRVSIGQSLDRLRMKVRTKYLEMFKNKAVDYGEALGNSDPALELVNTQSPASIVISAPDSTRLVRTKFRFDARASDAVEIQARIGSAVIRIAEDRRE